MGALNNFVSRDRRKGLVGRTPALPSWRGVTLVELLVAVALLGLVFTLFVSVLVPGLRIWTRSRQVADLEQQALVAEDRIVKSLLSSSASSVSGFRDANLSAVGMLSHGGSPGAAGYDTTNGRTRWTSATLFYLKADKVLRQASWTGSSPSLSGKALPSTQTFALSPTELQNVVNSPNRNGARLASKVDLFALTGPGETRPDGQVQPADVEIYLLTLELSTSTPDGEKRVHREVSVVPRIRERG